MLFTLIKDRKVSSIIGINFSLLDFGESLFILIISVNINRGFANLKPN